MHKYVVQRVLSLKQSSPLHNGDTKHYTQLSRCTAGYSTICMKLTPSLLIGTSGKDVFINGMKKVQKSN